MAVYCFFSPSPSHSFFFPSILVVYLKALCSAGVCVRVCICMYVCDNLVATWRHLKRRKEKEHNSHSRPCTYCGWMTIIGAYREMRKTQIIWWEVCAFCFLVFLNEPFLIPFFVYYNWYYCFVTSFFILADLFFFDAEISDVAQQRWGRGERERNGVISPRCWVAHRMRAGNGHCPEHEKVRQ